ncbi:uncharacterized protein isoform X2 [Rhodnius prolixus]|uniref:uncharacterized protein isoform X2 n=1 Tax=Rhodnius prolixus TaxID=13249 RepID=UPI003D18E7FA
MGIIGSDVHGFMLSSLLLTHCYSVLAILDKKGWYVEDEPRRNYRLEDFLWSGSGEGEGSGGSGSGSQAWATTTIFRTTTILTTVYPTPVWGATCTAGSSEGAEDCGPEIRPSSVPDSTETFSRTVTPSQPSDTVSSAPITPQVPLPDMSYWLVTIIRANVSSLDLSTAIFESRLAHLYKTAFQRQQERHLSGKNGEEKRRERREAVWVKVHRVSGVGGSGVEALELVYTVLVGGRPVSAKVAANDMRFVSQQEVVTLLGFPVLTKAEPYLKAAEQATSSSDERQTWLIVWSVVTSAILVALLLGLILLARAKKEKMFNREDAVEGATEAQGQENSAFQSDQAEKDALQKHAEDSASNSSDGLTKAEGHMVIPTKPTARPRSNKPSSPNSYLSMPSVKAFPRGAPIPGPLERVLEPEQVGAHLSRHSSESADPGVVGPLVWDLHCHRLSKRDPEDCVEEEATASVGRMRRRFHELLDDAFSLFGSRTGTPEEDKSTPNHIYGRAKSALIIPVDSLESEEVLRPKTSSAIRGTENHGPNSSGTGTVLARPLRGAWDLSPQHGAPARPLSAGPFHKPRLEPAWLLSDTSLSTPDPALPLIKAIKSELEKFPAVNTDKSQYKT